MAAVEPRHRTAIFPCLWRHHRGQHSLREARCQDEEIRLAATRAGADSFIRSKENGYDQQVGEGGNQLSAGQKQLISFARAILADPQILVMDEATSSVDTVTEQYIQQGMQKLLQDRFSLVIAHRLSTIRNADRILVIEQGNHAALLGQEGRYYSLYTRQSIQDLSRRQHVWLTAK